MQIEKTAMELDGGARPFWYDPKSGRGSWGSRRPWGSREGEGFRKMVRDWGPCVISRRKCKLVWSGLRVDGDEEIKVADVASP